MNPDDFPSPREGFLITHFLVVSDQDRSRAFYQSLFDGQVLIERDPVIMKVANTWLILAEGGSPTDDKPTVTLTTPPAPNPLPPTTAYNGNGQILLNGASVGDVTANANSTLILGAPGVTSTITVNTIKLNGNATLTILGTVILKVADQGQVQNPIDFTGGLVKGIEEVGEQLSTHFPHHTDDVDELSDDVDFE